ncbi:uncharacterized protein LOC135221986 [Macrobrachium nipponense]|uniref:uncharacterized protein LOC135221986 n=1 Tax=Macrobrachium nipponense TaxID=159736 RepID=UPI0030C82BBD
MSEMRRQSFWSRSCLLVIWTLCFLSVNDPKLAKGDVQTSSVISPSSEPSACTLRWKEELISCRGINHTQLVEELSKIKEQLNNKKNVAEGRNLDTGFGTDGSVPEGVKNESTWEQKSPSNRPEVRELSIFSCDIPKLTASNLDSPSALEILNVVSSGVKEVRPDALADHAQSLMRLVLTHNRLKALPEAIRNLTRLEVLDLTHNDVDHLPEGSLLFNLHRLRQLYLSHNKLGQILGAQARLGRQSPGLSLAVFNLEPLRESLTHLALANNGIPAFPEQFSRPFTRLSSLDLSSNDISEILPDGFQQMPHLQYLDLSGNLLKEFNWKNLASSVLDFNLRGNPWNCTCDSKWLIERLQSNDSGALMITPPTCSLPFHLRHREITSLKESDICPPKENSSNSEVVFIGDDVDGTLKLALKFLHLVNVTVLNHQALIISWRIDGDFYTSQNQSSKPLSWAITVHKTKDSPRSAKVTRMKLERYKEEQRDWRPRESSYTELLHGLETDTQYTLCLVPVQDDHLFTRPDQCQYIKTTEGLLHTTTASPSTIRTTSTTEAPTVPLLISTDDYEVQTERVIMLNEARKVLMSWNVTVHHRNKFNSHSKRETLLLKPLGWKITYRKFAEENETEIMLVSQGGEPIQNFTNHYTVDNLDPGTGYTFCFRPLSNAEVQASLKGDNGETYGPKISLHSNLHQNPKVISSTVRGWHQQQSDFSPSDTNSVEGDDTTNFSTNDFSPPTLPTAEPPFLSSIPSNIPPVPSEIPQGIPSNIPPVPNFPTPSSFDPRPPPQPQQPPGGNFVYTSTGERIPLPSSSGSSSPFNLPSIVGPSVPFNSPPSQWSSSSDPILDIPTKPQQRFTYDFDESSDETTSRQTFIYDFTTEAPATTTKEPQRFTYVTRRRRSVNSKPQVSYEKNAGPGMAELCKEVVTLDENNIIAPVAIASTVSTSTTVIIAIVFCCCCPRKCRRKKSGWQGKSLPNRGKISTISNPTPVNVYTRQSSVVSGTTVLDDSNSDSKSIPSQISANGTTFIDGDNNGHHVKTGRSISVASSAGYLTPLPASNGTVPDPDRIFSEAKLYLPSQKAYLNSVKDRLLQQHKDLKEFHPGYDIPPTSSIKSLLGYDYPHPTPVNPIGSHTDSTAKSPVSGKAPIPSPSSSDSNYNASVSDPREVESLRPEVNLNIPFNQNKSSDSSKKFNLSKDSDANKSTDYNYINPDDVNTKPRTYIKNAPARTRHRKFGSPVRLPDESNKDLMRHTHGVGPLQSPPHLSRSVPDLASAVRSPEADNQSLLHPSDMTAAARLNLLIGNQRKEEENGILSLPTIQPVGPTSKAQVSSASAEHLNEVGGYVNFPSSRDDTDLKQGKDKDHYHTWSSSRPNTPRSRPSLGEVVLTGGTLIEVPEGYVIPKPPKPTRSVRLLVPGEDKPIRLDKNEIRSGKSSMEYSSPPTSPKEIKTVSSLPPIINSSRRDDEKSQITHLMTPEMDQNRIIISTGLAV